MKTGRRIGQIRRAAGVTGRKRMRVTDSAACYHVMSRTVNGEFLLGDLEKEAFRRMMWRMSEFAGVEILTYALMDNHFHILLKVPHQEKWLKRFEGPEGEEKLITHLSTVYSKAFITQLRNEIAHLREQKLEQEITQLLHRFKKRFCNISLFVKELKERFSRWYNQQKGRRGTLWMDRFQSVLVENGKALRTISAYIDLNPVRAGLVDDPADSEWTGYGEAVRGSRRAKRGLCKALEIPQDTWDTKGLSLYRTWLYGEGVSVPETDPQTGKKRPATATKKRGFTVKQMLKVKEEQKEAQKGEHPAHLLLRNRVSTFTTGVAIGSENYIKEISKKYQQEFGRLKAKPGNRLLPGEAKKPKDGVFTMRH